MYTILDKTKYFVIFIVFTMFCVLTAEAKTSPFLTQNDSVIWSDSLELNPQGKWKIKSIAIGLAIVAGPFGVHRLYLGTSTYVPVAYTLTLGGGMGVLPVLDIVTILVTRDLRRIQNHRGMFLFLPK